MKDNGLLKTSPLFAEVVGLDIPIFERALNLDDFQHFNIFGKIEKFALPVTFTPYASVKPCSARCWFCSENLKSNNSNLRAASLRPTKTYQQQLGEVLLELTDVPLGLSLSGLEMSDDLDWLYATLNTLKNGLNGNRTWQEKAAYSNACGFAKTNDRKSLISVLSSFEFNRFEISRHHFDPQINQNIMNFREDEIIQQSDIFESAIGDLNSHLPISLVCIIQHQGVNSQDTLERYLKWARNLGVKKVIFRELCEVPNSYKNNRTFKNILTARIDIERLVRKWLSNKKVSINHFTDGYYFWNANFSFNDMEVVFERSDYAMMEDNHQSDIIHKLVFFANGNLCSGWEPDNNILNSTTRFDS